MENSLLGIEYIESGGDVQHTVLDLREEKNDRVTENGRSNEKEKFKQRENHQFSILANRGAEQLISAIFFMTACVCRLRVGRLEVIFLWIHHISHSAWLSPMWIQCH